MAELNYNTTDWLNLYINTNPVLRPAWSSIVEINDQFNFVNEQKNKLLRIVAISFGKDANSA
ncbi:MAG: hypothetical protein U9R19_12405, partial [Bacteroidota bacterium]|nr:hypothetical protein [Bacteroidota bacterium]